MSSVWGSLGQAIVNLFRLWPPADTTEMSTALMRLRHQVCEMQNLQTGRMNEMTSGTPDMRSIDQRDINAWADNVNAAVTALQTILKNGNLTAADESLMNTAIGNLDGVAGTSTPPAPAPSA